MRPNVDAPVYVISVASRLTGLPAWMLRLLDQEGIVVPVRTDKNRRLYSDNDIERLQRIRYLTEERGVNMAGVKVILELEDARLRAERGPGPIDIDEEGVLIGRPDTSRPAR